MKISVIIPIRNTPKLYLRECLESLGNQRFRDFEIICVDDASENTETKDYLRELKKQRSIMVYFLDKAQGAANARNYGLKKAKGEYVVFVDSDDICDENFLNELYYKAKECDSDVCVCGILMFDNYNRNNVLDREEVGDYLSKYETSDYLCRVTSSPCNKLCRRTYLLSENIWFQDLPSDNDTYYAIMSMMCTDRVSFVEKELYYYRFNTDFQITYNRNPIYHLIALKKIKEDIVLKKQYNVYFDELINVYFILIGVVEIKHCKDRNMNKLFYDEMREYLICNDISVLNQKADMYLQKWKKNPFENGWTDLLSDYYHQLNDSFHDIIKLLSLSGKKTYVWGRGKRCDAFERLAKQNGIQINGICDIRNDDCNESDQYGNMIIHSDIVLNCNDVIIATNHTIYEYLKKKAFSKVIVDLEHYCPL